MIINKKYTFPRQFPVKLTQSNVFSIAFVKEIGRNNGVLYSGIWPTQIVQQFIKYKKGYQ